jgi:Ig domain of plant-specific actin-binding protein
MRRFRRPLVLAFAAGCACLAAGLAGAVPEPPTATARPTVAGIAAVGKQLTAQTGTWAASGALTYAYQWYRCDASGAACLSIHGAVSPTYTAVASDAGQTLGLAVTASGATGTASGIAYASLVGPIAPAKALLESTSQPTLSGTAAVGKTLQVSTGSWSPTPAKLAYLWQRCNANGRLCTSIASATEDSYTVTAADDGHALVAVVQGTFGTTTQDVWSSASVPVAGADVVGPTAALGPTVTGTEAQGSQLSISPGIWNGTGPISYAYQWYRCDEQGAHCNSVHGATAETYRLTAHDAGKTIGVTLRATDSTGTAVAYASLVGPIGPHGAAISALAQPGISGQPKAGTELSVSTGSWTEAGAKTTFAWLRCNANGRLCTAIAGATAGTYTPTAADFDHRLVAAVTATVAAGSATAFSAATGPVA